MKAALFVLVVAITSARCQDPTQPLAAQQQAMANQQAIQQAASSDSMVVFGSPGSLPTFSIKSGNIKPGSLVRIRWRGADYAAVYYSTDGSTPTTASMRYKGPIIINSTTNIQAIGVAWNGKASKIVQARYDVASATKPPKQH